MHTHLSGVAFHVHCVNLGCHVVIGVGRLVVRFHHAYVIPSFLHVVVRLYLVIVNSHCSHNYCLLHIAKTGHLRCCITVCGPDPCASVRLVPDVTDVPVSPCVVSPLVFLEPRSFSFSRKACTFL